MNNYRVNFFRLEKEETEKGKMETVGKEYLGSVIVDDNGVNMNLTLTAKAFRQASSVCQLADFTSIEKL